MEPAAATHNDSAVRAITAALSIPVQLGGGVRSLERAEALLSFGLDRVILGTVALEQPELVEQLAARYPGRIVVGIDARNGKVATGAGSPTPIPTPPAWPSALKASA